MAKTLFRYIANRAFFRDFGPPRFKKKPFLGYPENLLKHLRSGRKHSLGGFLYQKTRLETFPSRLDCQKNEFWKNHIKNFLEIFRKIAITHLNSKIKRNP